MSLFEVIVSLISVIGIFEYHHQKKLTMMQWRYDIYKNFIDLFEDLVPKDNSKLVDNEAIMKLNQAILKLSLICSSKTCFALKSIAREKNFNREKFTELFAALRKDLHLPQSSFAMLFFRFSPELKITKEDYVFFPYSQNVQEKK